MFASSCRPPCGSYPIPPGIFYQLRHLSRPPRILHQLRQPSISPSRDPSNSCGSHSGRLGKPPPPRSTKKVIKRTSCGPFCQYFFTPPRPGFCQLCQIIPDPGPRSELASQTEPGQCELCQIIPDPGPEPFPFSSSVSFSYSFSSSVFFPCSPPNPSPSLSSFSAFTFLRLGLFAALPILLALSWSTDKKKCTHPGI